MQTWKNRKFRKNLHKKYPGSQESQLLAETCSFEMYSQEKRMEKYRAMYVWKILEGITPNCGLEETTSNRRGRDVKIDNAKG